MKLRSTIKIISSILLVVSLAGCSKDSIDDLSGTLIQSLVSPSNTFKFNLYEQDMAFNDPPNCFGDVVDYKGESRRIFFQYRGNCSLYELAWSDEETIVIWYGTSFKLSLNIFEDKVFNYENETQLDQTQ